MKTQFQVGDKVGAGRCAPGREPWCGELLSACDPRVWKDTIAFPTPDSEDSTFLPDVEKVREHVVKCVCQGLLLNEVPVLWTFSGYKKIHWERVSSVVPYAEEYAQWQAQQGVNV